MKDFQYLLSLHAHGFLHKISAICLRMFTWQKIQYGFQPLPIFLATDMILSYLDGKGIKEAGNPKVKQNLFPVTKVDREKLMRIGTIPHLPPHRSDPFLSGWKSGRFQMIWHWLMGVPFLIFNSGDLLRGLLVVEWYFWHMSEGGKEKIFFL